MTDEAESDEDLDERLIKIQARLARQPEVTNAAERFLLAVISAGEKIAPGACPPIAHKHAALSALEWRLIVYFRNVARRAAKNEDKLD